MDTKVAVIFVVPKTITEWWIDKIKGTQKRDCEAEEQLKLLGWKVVTVWEFELKKDKNKIVFGLILKGLKTQLLSMELSVK